MKYYSTKNKLIRSTLREAVIEGIASDGGLFMPERIDVMPRAWFAHPPSSLADIAFDVAHQLIGEDVPAKDLRAIVEKAVDFDVRLAPIGDDTWALELFHGPTLAFKDFGARFLAGLMEYYASNQDREIVVLAATSGDTGSAVAHGFFNKRGIRVIILYPSGKVSPLQEKQLTTLGGNITAWEIDGTFDDCQRLVKQMFLDKELKQKFLLTSANSINIGRLVPQTFYYFYAWTQVGRGGEIIFSVPSGNFGNLTAGVMATRLGLPVRRFVAATNANDVVPSYLSGNAYASRPSVATISNAMDVGDPSNFQRLLDLFNGSRESMCSAINGYAFTDEETRKAIADVYVKYNYLMDPHGAVAWLGLRRSSSVHRERLPGVFLETAHPGKFLEVVEETIGGKVDLPQRLASVQSQEKRSIRVSRNFEDARQLLLRK
jgi:threonine synthase